MEKEQLAKILHRHQLWLENKEGGEQANLRWANLRWADLRRANLREANLREADLCRVDLRGANLREVDLRGANLCGANLQGADLCRVDLRGANLCGANLDFSCWPLWCGSLEVTVDKRIATQLAYHFFRVHCDDPEVQAAQKALAPLANQFHRVEECGRVDG